MVVPLATGVSGNDDYQRACGTRETPLNGTDSFGSLPELEDLDKEGFQSSQVDLAEVADGAEVGDVLADDDAAGDIDVASPHDPPRGAGAGGVAVQQQRDHHPGLEWGLTAKFPLVMGEDRREVEGGDGVQEEVDEVAFREPVVGRGWEEVGLVGRPIAVGLGHATLGADRERLGEGPRDYSKVIGRRQYSDRLSSSKIARHPEGLR
jgi:hypothetical protein